MKVWSLSIRRAYIRRLYQLLLIVGCPVLFGGGIWCLGALHYAFGLSAGATAAAGIVFALLLASGFFRRRALFAMAVAEAALLVAFSGISPEKKFRDVEWQTPWKRVARITELPDGRFAVANVRDFHYRSENDYDVSYTAITVDPEKISSVDVALSHWNDHTGIAHSMLGFNFSDGTSIVASLETRLPEGIEQNALAGLYRSFALAMIIGTPRDLYGLRTDHRGEALYVYRCNFPAENMRALVRRFLSRSERLAITPEFYNSLCKNCTTGLLPLLFDADQRFLKDIRLIVNGLSDHLLFQNGMLVKREKEGFDSLRARSLVPGICFGSAARQPYRGTSEAQWLRNKNTSPGEPIQGSGRISGGDSARSAASAWRVRAENSCVRGDPPTARSN